jgi:hypothetical protein
MPLTPQRVWNAIHEAQDKPSMPEPSDGHGPLGESGRGSAGSGPTAPSDGGAQ